MEIKPKKTLIASDYDGTIRIDGKIAPSDVAALKAWRASGRYFGIVTGRGRDFINTIHQYEIAEAGLELDFVVMNNGALITDADGNEWFSSEIDEADFAALETLFSKIPDTIAYSRVADGGSRQQYYARYETPERALEVAAYINGVMGDKIEAFVNYWHINITRRGISKASGVSAVLAHYGLPEEEGIVVGDDWNDLSMLTAHDGYVMERGIPAIQEKIGKTTPSVGELAKSFM